MYVINPVKFFACKIWWPHCMSLGISWASVFADQGKPRGCIVQVVCFMNDVAFRRNLRQPSSIIQDDPTPTVREQTFLTVGIRENYNASLRSVTLVSRRVIYIYLYCVTPFNTLRPRDELTEQQFLESRMRSVTGPTHMLITHPCTHLFSFRIGSERVHSTYLMLFLICMCSRLQV